MICPECYGKGEAIYYVETDRDENTVTVKKIKDICHTCNGSGKKPQTNADRIRAMSNEELATDLLDMFEEICEDGVPCKEWMLGWLKQTAEPPKEE